MFSLIALYIKFKQNANKILSSLMRIKQFSSEKLFKYYTKNKFHIISVYCFDNKKIPNKLGIF